MSRRRRPPAGGRPHPVPLLALAAAAALLMVLPVVHTTGLSGLPTRGVDRLVAGWPTFTYTRTAYADSGVNEVTATVTVQPSQGLRASVVKAKLSGDADHVTCGWTGSGNSWKCVFPGHTTLLTPNPTISYVAAPTSQPV